MLRFRWITFDRFKVVNLSRFYRVNFIRPYWVNFTVFSNINKVSAGEIIPVPTQRPLTLVGFRQFAGISRQNFYEYESREEFSDILMYVREAIEADQLQGAIVGFYDSGIIARVLHLADRQDVTTNGKEITTATQPISVVLDPEAAKIIQSIGRRTVKE